MARRAAGRELEWSLEKPASAGFYLPAENFGELLDDGQALPADLIYRPENKFSDLGGDTQPDRESHP
ncbi:hypothetical protein PSCICG_04160 [Pseudomonas cichorii]|nr:hypothetical protein PSCICG_04160 [Pseudomonas cichorii]